MMKGIWTKADQDSLKYPHKTKTQIKREKDDQKLQSEFGNHPRFVGLDWYVAKSDDSRHRCLVYKCTCGMHMKLLPSSVRKGYNPDLLCSNCVTVRRRHGVGSVQQGMPSTKG